ncbi:MAG TPA: ABC transporter permease [Candidatus Baltobacteraceae bacterium]|nr:ABC transporter permease [Candidatus Baltobacteraceae bacterium]
MRQKGEQIQGTLIAFIVLSLLAAAWFLLTPRFVRDLMFPSPASVWQSVTTLGWELPWHAAATFARVLLGWGSGVPLGIFMGLTMSWNARVHAVAHTVIEGVRPLPPIALIPFFILWFGLGMFGQVLLIALGCFMVLTVNTYTAVRNIPQVYLRAGVTLGAPRLALYQSVILPAILPSLVGGFRIAAGLAFGLALASEFMGAQSGIGFLMMVAERTLNTNTILLGVIIIAVESYLFDLVIRHVSAHLCRWTDTPLELS